MAQPSIARLEQPTHQKLLWKIATFKETWLITFVLEEIESGLHLSENYAVDFLSKKTLFDGG